MILARRPATAKIIPETAFLGRNWQEFPATDGHRVAPAVESAGNRLR